LCTHSSSIFNDTSTTEIYTLSLHDALPISRPLERIERFAIVEIAVRHEQHLGVDLPEPVHHPFHPEIGRARRPNGAKRGGCQHRSEEHTSELQSRENLVCRLLLEKKKKNTK